MRPTLSERKGEILIRSAESRLGVIESLASARSGAERTWARLGAPRTYMKAGLATCGGVLGMLLLRRIVSRNKVVPVQAVQAVRGGSSLMPLVVQALTLLLFPWLRSHMAVSEWGNTLKRYSPSNIFFRWLGLEK